MAAYGGIIATAVACNADSAADTPDDDSRVKVEFTCGSDDDTRTSFGQSNGSKIPIYWTEGDAVRIYSPQSAPAQADYSICPAAEGPSTKAALEQDEGAAGLVWTREEQDFYGFYPAGAGALQYADAEFTAALPSIQTCRNGECDMSLVYMTAAAEGMNVGQPVSLTFSPAVTVLEIKFSAAENCTVREIIVSSDDEAVAGTFRYDPVKKRITEVSLPSSRLSLRMADADGNSGIALTAGQECRATAFLLPQSLFSALHIDIVTTEMTAGRDMEIAVGGRYKYTVDMGRLPAATAASKEKLYRAWQSRIPDNALLSGMSIPGTHDAATQNISLAAFSQCQSLSIAAQLELGVRCFDLRPTGTSNLMIYHGTSTGVTFDEAISAMVSFMQKNPTEGCIVQMQFQNDALAQGNESTWKSVMGNYLNNGKYKSYFAAYRRGLTMGELRGKILVLTRSDYDGALVGGKLNNWGDNATDRAATLTNGSISDTFYLQDYYSGNESDKIAAFKAYRDKALQKEAGDWLCNFTSLSGTPKSHAENINPQATDYLRAKSGCTGIVMMDFAGDASTGGDQLLKATIDQNALYLLPMSN